MKQLKINANGRSFENKFLLYSCTPWMSQFQECILSLFYLKGILFSKDQQYPCMLFA